MFLRKFIILNKQSSKDVKGHARLEVRGTKAKLSLSLEGAKFKEGIKYRAYFAMNEQNGFKELALGTVDVNRSGRGKLDIDFNPKSVNESRIDMNSFNILNLKEENAETMEDRIVLGGYIHKEDDSISKLISKKNKEKSPKDKRTEKLVKTSEKIDKNIEEKIDSHEKLKPKSKLKSKPENIEIKKEEKTEVKEKIKQEMKIEEKLNETNSNDYSQQVANYTLDVLENFKEIKPFKTEEENQRWWKITPNKSKDQRGFLPYHNYILNSPCQKQVLLYNNYLFGVVESESKITHYIYGIPGRYKKSEHPYEGKTGFITWLEDKEGTGNGYWLSYIDINTGNVVRPL